MAATNGANGAKVVPVQGDRNTNRCHPAKRWCYTLNNYNEQDIEDITGANGANGAVYLMQEEIGESGTPHLQGYIEFTKKVRPKGLYKNKGIHWEKARKNRLANLAYCSKTTFDNARMWHKGVDEKYLKKTLPKKRGYLHSCRSGMTLWHWCILHLIKQEPDRRKIHWIVDTKGGRGKTALAKHIIDTYGLDNVAYVCGNARDMKCAISFMKPKFPKIIIMDFPRTVEGEISYRGMEEIKNGLFFSGKYESGTCYFNIPHVICLANFYPVKNKLSLDRWNICDLDIIIGINDEELNAVDTTVTNDVVVFADGEEDSSVILRN